MNKLDKLLKEALDNQRKIDETIKFIKENEEHLTEEQEDKLDEIKYKMEEELLPEIENLDKNKKTMNNEKYNQIIEESYGNYYKETMFDSNPKWLEPVPVMNMKTGERTMGARQYHKEGFINKCKTDPEFSEKWRLKIEERELSLDERNDLLNKETNRNHKRENCFTDEEFERETLQDCKAFNIPTKLITITYKNETIGVYK